MPDACINLNKIYYIWLNYRRCDGVLVLGSTILFTFVIYSEFSGPAAAGTLLLRCGDAQERLLVSSRRPAHSETVDTAIVGTVQATAARRTRKAWRTTRPLHPFMMRVGASSTGDKAVDVEERHHVHAAIIGRQAEGGSDVAG